ncbi:MAG TPA: hypothetical protein VFR33_10740, partial [Candidatus Dormibacteraeota bacterium]|nr:hypothetical protein [Candidatus Dormibacteraeota bacterium]
GGVLYLHAHDTAKPFHTSGHLRGKPAIEVEVSHDGRDLGRLSLGRRRGGVEYSRRDLQALNMAAATLGEALVLGTTLGHLLTVDAQLHELTEARQLQEAARR